MPSGSRLQLASERPEGKKEGEGRHTPPTALPEDQSTIFTSSFGNGRDSVLPAAWSPLSPTPSGVTALTLGFLTPPLASSFSLGASCHADCWVCPVAPVWFFFISAYSFWLHWVFAAACASSSCGAWGLLSAACRLLVPLPSLVAELELRCGLRGCGAEGLVALWHVGSSRVGDGIRVIGSWIF